MTPKVIRSHAQDIFKRIYPEVKTRHVKVTLRLLVGSCVFLFPDWKLIVHHHKLPVV